jgi:AcrR family transcriptional regulator
MSLSTSASLASPQAAIPHAPLVPVTARGEATRRKLILAAEQEFGSKGFHFASVSSITARANVGQGTFYLYFHSKEEVFTTLVYEIGRGLRRALRDAAGLAHDPVEAQRQALETFLRYSAENPGRYRIVQESQFVDATAFRDFYEHLARLYTDDIEAAPKEPGKAASHAWAAMGIAHFLAMRDRLKGAAEPTLEAVNAAMDLIANGVAPRRA